MKALLPALLACAVCACASNKPVEHPPEDKGQVHGFPADWAKEPEKHGLPPNKPTTTPTKQDDPAK